MQLDSEVNFRSLFEQAAVGMAQVSLSGEWMMVNSAFCRLLDYSREDLMLRSFLENLHPDDRAAHQTYQSSLLEGTVLNGSIEERYLNKNHSSIWVMTSIALVRNQQGEPQHFIKTVQNISDRKQSENALKRQLKRALLLQKITDAIRAQLDPQQLFETIVFQVGQAFGVDRCILFAYTQKPTRRLPVVAEYVESKYAPITGRILPIKKNFPWMQIFHQERAMAVPNVYANPLFQDLEPLFQEIELKSVLMIRTSYQGMPNGLLVLNQCDRFRQWTSHDIHVIESIAAQAGIALAQVSLLEREKRQRELLDQQNIQLRREIHERKQAEEHLQLFFSQSLDGFFFMMLDQPVQWDDTVDKEQVLDYVFAHQRFTKVNSAILKQYGAEREQFLGLTPNDFFEHNLAYGRDLWQQLFDAGRLHVETDERKLDGTPIWIEGDYICLYDAHGHITGHFGVQRDITDRKQAEAKLKASEERWQLAIKGSNDGIFDVDLKTLEAFHSERWSEMLGYDKDEVDTHNVEWSSRIHPEDLDRVISANQAHLNRETPFFMEEYRLRCKDGSYKWILGRGQALWDEQGNAIRMVGSHTDISELKNAESVLRRQQVFLRSVIDGPPNLIFAKDWYGRFVLANQAVAEIYGTTVEDLIGKTDADFNPNPAEVEHFLADDQAVILSQQPKLIEEKVTSATGESRYFQTIKKPIFSVHDQSALVLGVATDITDRKLAENALREAAKREKAALRVVERMRRTLDMEQIFNATVDEMREVLNCDRVVIYRFDTAKQGTCVAESVASPWSSLTEMCVRDPALLDEACFDDRCIVKTWQTQDRSASAPCSEEYFSSDFSHSLCYRCVSDVSQAQLDGQYLQLLENFHAKAYIIVPIFQEKKLWGLLASYQNSGPRHWESTETGLVVHISTQLGVALQQAELLAQTQKQSADLEKARDAAEAANHAKSEFLANISHELRTPLNAILGFTQIMSHDHTLNPDHQKHLEIINRSGHHLLGLINDVLEMSKIEAGRMKLTPTNVDLYHLLNSLEEMIRVKAIAKHLTLSFERSTRVPRYITTDENKLRQILLNLLDNAIKFTAEGGVILRVRVEEEVSDRQTQRRGDTGTWRHEDTETRQRGAGGDSTALPALSSSPAFSTPTKLFFEVEDTGSGIAPEEIQRLFKPFVQTRSGLTSSEGTGLGLAISHKFVELLGGAIVVTSTPGYGSRFCFDIQTTLAPITLPSSLGVAPRVIGCQPNQPTYRLLIVEDKWENSLLLMELLEPVGFEVKVARNGQEGIALWQSWHPHLIWMDMQMPVMSGYEATKHIKATMTGKETIIIAVTSSAFEEDRSTILEVGCDDFIRKPFQEAVIFAKLTEYLQVQFIYEENESRSGVQNPVAEKMGDNWLTPEHLQVMPDEWIAKLHQAAIEGRDYQLLELIQQIPVSHRTIGKALENLVNNFCFEKLIQLTRTVENSAQALQLEK
ncbi:MAG: PAS domain S-box protein [Scytolyngbya sp. HA4215-MV1]|jgi:PAS domain S-box-containing protein|nr:PAS domain S-box protein [Scytolyngbya sp. HA4215-MV1]